MPLLLLLAFFFSSRCSNLVVALGSQCSVHLGDGSAGQDEPYWLEKIKHQGLSAYNNNPASYKTFRNVKDFGAKGDGVTDDTQAILSVGMSSYLVQPLIAVISRAMWTGDRCGMNCGSSTTSPATVYFPQGFVDTYMEDTAPLIFSVTEHTWSRTLSLLSTTRRLSATPGNRPPSSQPPTSTPPHSPFLVGQSLVLVSNRA